MSRPVVFLTIAEAAQRAGLSQSGLRKRIARGLLRSYTRPGSRAVLVREDELIEHLRPAPRRVLADGEVW